MNNPLITNRNSYLEKLTNDELANLENYIFYLETQIQQLQADNRDLENTIDVQESKLDEALFDNTDYESQINELTDELYKSEAAMAFLSYLIQEKYFLSYKKYDTLDKVLDKAEFILNYGEFRE